MLDQSLELFIVSDFFLNLLKNVKNELEIAVELLVCHAHKFHLQFYYNGMPENVKHTS